LINGKYFSPTNSARLGIDRSSWRVIADFPQAPRGRELSGRPGVPARRQDIGASDLELPFAAALVAITLIVGFTPGAADLDQKSALLGIEVIDLALPRGTGRLTHED
jgi:hypothetical protein